MKVYDIILAFVRATVVLSLIREVASVASLSIRALALINYWRFPATRAELFSDFASPVIGIIVSFLILAASRPIARFAANITASAAIADHF